MSVTSGICLACATTSTWVKVDPSMVYGECLNCHKVTDCIRGDSIVLWVPYIPLQELRLFTPKGPH